MNIAHRGRKGLLFGERNWAVLHATTENEAAGNGHQLHPTRRTVIYENDEWPENLPHVNKMKSD